MKYSFRINFIGEEGNIYLVHTFSLLSFPRYLPVVGVRGTNIWNTVTKEDKLQ